MASEVKADKLSPSGGTALQIGDASDTITIPTGATFTITDGLGVAGGGTGLTSFTAGDVFYATGTTTLAKLAKGSAEEVLSMNSGATAPEWTTAAATAGGTGQTGFTAGDLLYANSTTTLTKLGKGTARQGLQTNSGATAPEWVNSPQSLMTAAGDIIYASGANTLAKLAKGSDDEVLTLASGVPSWAAAAGGGAWNLLSTQTASGATDIDFVHGSGDIDLTTYKMYKITAVDIDSSDDDVDLSILYSDDTGVSYETTNYENMIAYLIYANSNWSSAKNSVADALHLETLGNGAGETCSFEFTFSNPAGALWKAAWYTAVLVSADGPLTRQFYATSMWKSTADVDAIRFTISAGTFDGIFKLYGIS